MRAWLIATKRQVYSCAGSRSWLVLLAFVLFRNHPVPSTSAQEDGCLALLQTAVEQTRTVCSNLETGTLCYGYPDVHVESQNGSAMQMARPGERMMLNDVATLATSTGEAAWGIATLALAGDSARPDDPPVTLALVGAAHLTNIAPHENVAIPTCTATNASNGSVNIRSGPGTDRAIVATLPPNETVTANGRNAAGDWLRIDRNGETGWVFVGLFAVDCDFTATLPVVADNEPIAIVPILNLALRGGLDGACPVLPDGLLFHLPPPQRATLSLNNTVITLNGTGFVEVLPDGAMQISVLAGTATLGPTPEATQVLGGTFVTVPRNGPPTSPDIIIDAGTVRLLVDTLVYGDPFALALADYLNAITPAAVDQEIAPITCTVGDSFVVDMPLRRTPAADTTLAIQYGPGGDSRLATIIQNLETLRATCLEPGTQRLFLTARYSDGQHETLGYTFIIHAAE